MVGVTGLVIRGPDVVYFSLGPLFLSPIRVDKCAGQEARWGAKRFLDFLEFEAENAARSSKDGQGFFM